MSSTSLTGGQGKEDQPTPLRSALKTDDDVDRTPPASGSLKAVQIAEPIPEEPIDDDGLVIKQFRTGHGRRMSGKFQPPQPTSSARSSLYDGSPALRPVDDSSSNSHQAQNHQHYHSHKLLAQVGDWLERERQRVATRTNKYHHHRKSVSPSAAKAQGDEGARSSQRQRSDSIDSQSDEVSLDKLQRILEQSMTSLGLGSMPRHTPKMPRSTRSRKRRPSLHRTASSDTDYVDGDAIVPDCDVWIDNSKTLALNGSTANLEELDERAQRDRESWLTFKNEIIRAAHTLKLKGWRKIPLESGELIDVERVSGALTNAVYVVTPPSQIPGHEGQKMPPKVLLRIYGPQVEHLIDRENELKVLQRLARKKIGPRLMGTFRNGRFEQYFHASPLTPDEMRDPDVSKQIAKRMRELHDGIELLPQERENGPGVWRNWDQWLDNVGRIASFLDKQVESPSHGSIRRDSVIHAWKSRGYVFGVPWPQFRDMIDKYRQYLYSFYKDQKAISESLVFCHNDTQYGNILRFQPDDAKSPLLQPANKHKQLIVIDFEYAAANVPGLDAANQFTEWTYNYHDENYSWACDATRYPTLEEQNRFLKAYVDHRPHFPHASSTPLMGPRDSTSSGDSTPASLHPTASSSSIVDFMLDSRAPPGGWSAAERSREEQTEKRVRELHEEAKLWRPANSALWTAWGVVQAKVPGLNADEEPEDEAEEAVDDFDYLSYSQDRALFFWGDMVVLGLIKREDLPEPLRSRVKIVTS